MFGRYCHMCILTSPHGYVSSMLGMSDAGLWCAVLEDDGDTRESMWLKTALLEQIVHEIEVDFFFEYGLRIRHKRQQTSI